MTVLVIREHSRFAVCKAAKVLRDGSLCPDVLLIELSLSGCRLGNVPDGTLTPGETVEVQVDGAQPFSGTVRWTIDGSIGVKLARRLHIAELEELIRQCRDDMGRGAALGA